MKSRKRGILRFSVRSARLVRAVFRSLREQRVKKPGARDDPPDGMICRSRRTGRARKRQIRQRAFPVSVREAQQIKRKPPLHPPGQAGYGGGGGGGRRNHASLLFLSEHDRCPPNPENLLPCCQLNVDAAVLKLREEGAVDSVVGNNRPCIGTVKDLVQ